MAGYVHSLHLCPNNLFLIRNLLTHSTDMVAAEERKMEARKSAAKDIETSHKSAKGKENKDKIASEHKAAGKPVRKDAAEHEAKNQQTQSEKLSDARASA